MPRNMPQPLALAGGVGVPQPLALAGGVGGVATTPDSSSSTGTQWPARRKHDRKGAEKAAGRACIHTGNDQPSLQIVFVLRSVDEGW